MAGNTFGHIFTVTSFGESHGPAIGCVVDGCPPGLALSSDDIQQDLDRRKPGTSRHVTQRQESDRVEILSGMFEGKTTGTPIALLIRNEDARSKDYGNLIDTFRPGHADYTYWQKYGIRDHRGGGRASARETAVRVAAAAIARKWLRETHGVVIHGYLSQLGPHEIPFKSWDAVERQSVFCSEPGRRGQARIVHGRAAEGRRLGRRQDHHGGRTCSRRMGRSGLCQAGCGFGGRDDEHQCRKGGRNRLRVRVGHPARIGAWRRADARRVRHEPCRRHPGRHFHRPGHCRDDRHQADLEHPCVPPLDRQAGESGDGGDERPPRSVRWDSSHPHRRSDDGAGPDGPCLASSCAKRGCADADAADRRFLEAVGSPSDQRKPVAKVNPEPHEA